MMPSTKTASSTQYCMKHSQQCFLGTGDSAGLQVCMGGKEFETVRYGTESAARYYDMPSSLNQLGAAISNSPRFHSHAFQGESPGAQYDHESFLRASRADVAAFTMPKAIRANQSNTNMHSPGAPAYLIKRDAAHYRFPASSGFSMAANLRTDWAAIAPGNESPGPGTYSVQKSFGKPDIRAS
jgi:hypothetical protein